MDKIKIFIQYLIPQRWLTQLAGWFAESRCGWITRVAIIMFIRFYKVNMSEAQYTDISMYTTFNDFFTRLLIGKARPIDNDPAVIVWPADGTISQFGTIEKGHIFQAKNYRCNLKTLMAGYEPITRCFHNGIFITTYLSPSDYHRVHMPCNGTLRDVLYIPGNLFSVSPLTISNIPNILARNERLVCIFDTDFGLMAQILVGAVIVGSIETVWSGVVTTRRKEGIKHWCYSQTSSVTNISLLKGQEMARFKLGSTVISIFDSRNVFLEEHLHIGYITRFGQPLARGIQHDT